MQLKLDQDGFVIGYAIIGSINNGLDYYGETPLDFRENYASYKLIDGKLEFCEQKKQELADAKRAEELSTQLEIEIQKRMRELAFAQPSEEMMELQGKIEKLSASNKKGVTI